MIFTNEKCVGCNKCIRSCKKQKHHDTLTVHAVVMLPVMIWYVLFIMVSITKKIVFIT